jgi:hypothetical protein
VKPCDCEEVCSEARVPTSVEWVFEFDNNPPLFEILRSGEKIRTKEPSILVISESQ